jgi:hypothetical protein
MWLNSTSLPSTNTYQGGIILATGINIVVNSPPGEVMTFAITLGAPVQQTSTCSDGVKNGNEVGVDCGGPCAPCRSTCQVRRSSPPHLALSGVVCRGALSTHGVRYQASMRHNCP